MKKVFLTIALVISQFGISQVYVGGGAFVGNQDNDNPINLTELREWDGFQSGVKLGDWMTKEQLNEFRQRTDGRLFGYNLNVGINIPVVKYNLQGVDMSAGLDISGQFNFQSTNENYEEIGVGYSAGVYADLGFRMTMGLQSFANGELDKFFQIDAPVALDGKLRLFARVNWKNPFTHDIKSVFALDGSPISIQTGNVGIKFSF